MNRFEYRCFDRHLGHLDQRLRQLAGSPDIRESREVYLLAAGRLDQNLKIRGGQLDLKTRVQTRDGFEQWAPAGKWRFPLASTALKTLKDALGLERNITESEAMTPEALVDALTQTKQTVLAIDLFKRRFGYRLEQAGAEVSAEWAEVEINGAGIQTVCVESTDLEAATELAETIGLLAHPNCNYLQALARVTGLEQRAQNPS